MIKVCIIEDEPEIRKLLRRIVEKQDGFTVVSETGDFTSAVTDFTKYRPDVAFVDIDLAGESGLECARVLTELNPKLKVIFATAHSEYMANAFEIYAFDYLVKPFDVERVVKTLSRLKRGVFEERMDPKEFMRCHKSYVISLSRISKIEPYGRWTYIVKFKGTSETALITA